MGPPWSRECQNVIDFGLVDSARQLQDRLPLTIFNQGTLDLVIEDIRSDTRALQWSFPAFGAAELEEAAQGQPNNDWDRPTVDWDEMDYQTHLRHQPHERAGGGGLSAMRRCRKWH